MTLTDPNTELFRPSTSIPVAHPEASKALEAAWQRRREELGDWQPSNGWLLEPSVSVKRQQRVR